TPGAVFPAATVYPMGAAMDGTVPASRTKAPLLFTGHDQWTIALRHGIHSCCCSAEQRQRGKCRRLYGLVWSRNPPGHAGAHQPALCPVAERAAPVQESGSLVHYGNGRDTDSAGTQSWHSLYPPGFGGGAA